MKRKRFSVEQIAYAIAQAESGTVVTEICRQMGVSEPTFYRWKKKYSGMGVSEVRRLKAGGIKNRQPCHQGTQALAGSLMRWAWSPGGVGIDWQQIESRARK